MSEVMQERLFEVPRDPIAEGRTLMMAFIAEETATLDITKEQDCITAVEVMLIAAERHAQTIAASRGDIDPDEEAFLSEVLMGRLNADDSPEVFRFEIDKVWRDIRRTDASIVACMEAQAFAIAQTLVDEQLLTRRLG